MSQWYAKTPGQVLSELDVRQSSGLSPGRRSSGWRNTALTSWPGQKRSR